MAAVLSPQQINEALASLQDWSQEGEAIVSDFDFRDFSEALTFVNSVGIAAEQANHHPDIDIRYSKVRMLLTSHDSGGITQRDLKMAKRISEIFAAEKKSAHDA